MCTKLKAILMAIILAGFASQQAAAENFSEEEMAFAFGDSTIDESAEMVLLSNEEMMATEGDMFPAFIIGFGVRFIANKWVRHHASNITLGYGTYSYAKNRHENNRNK